LLPIYSMSDVIFSISVSFSPFFSFMRTNVIYIA
jgi:hypothetical protein